MAEAYRATHNLHSTLTAQPAVRFLQTFQAAAKILALRTSPQLPASSALRAERRLN